MRAEVAMFVLAIATRADVDPHRNAWRLTERLFRSLYLEERAGGEWVDLGGES